MTDSTTSDKTDAQPAVERVDDGADEDVDDDTQNAPAAAEKDSDPYAEQVSWDDDAGGDTTTSASTRHKFTNDYLAGGLIGAQIVLLSVALAVGADVPQLIWWAFVAEGLMAATWAFGRGAASMVLEAVQK